MATLGGLLLAAAGLYGYWVHSLITERSPHLLLICLDRYPAFMAWHCKTVLRYRPLSPDQVAELNSMAGIRFPLYIDDKELGLELARLFITQGVDINATDLYKRFTALHGSAIGAHLHEARALLDLGARIDVKDSEGRTPLQLAQAAAQRFPDEPQRKEMVALLERAASAPAK